VMKARISSSRLGICRDNDGGAHLAAGKIAKRKWDEYDVAVTKSRHWRHLTRSRRRIQTALPSDWV
jgi:hypothetical protein